jgi:ribosomal protein L34
MLSGIRSQGFRVRVSSHMRSGIRSQGFRVRVSSHMWLKFEVGGFRTHAVRVQGRDLMWFDMI